MPLTASPTLGFRAVNGWKILNGWKTNILNANPTLISPKINGLKTKTLNANREIGGPGGGIVAGICLITMGDL